MAGQEKTAEEWQKQIDAQHEQNLAWVSNIGAFMARTDAQMKHLQGVLEAFMEESRASRRQQDRILDELRATRQNGSGSVD